MYSELGKITRLLCIVLVLHHHHILSFTFHRIIESRSLLRRCPCDSSRRRVPLFSSKYDLNNHKSFTNEKISETHSSEFYLEPIKESQIRRDRIEQETRNKDKFCSFGDDLWALRKTMKDLNQDLIESLACGDKIVEESIKSRLDDLEQKDPEAVYTLELEQMNNVMKDQRKSMIHKENALNARSVLPQFNFHGIWVGKFGDHGYELVNVTYIGDTLIARKVTGDKNVPKGEISFQVDLSPLLFHKNSQNSDENALPPIILSEDASNKWGTKELTRYRGLGQVAEEGFKNNQWMEGQFIIIGEDYFSFSWMPISHQVFFSRPTPEMQLDMLREEIVIPSSNSDISAMRGYALRCFDKTIATMEDDMEDGKIDRLSNIYLEEQHFE